MNRLTAYLLALWLALAPAWAQVGQIPFWPPIQPQASGLTCTLTNGNGTFGQGTLINDASMSTPNNAFLNTGSQAFNAAGNPPYAAAHGTDTASPHYVGTDFGSGVAWKPCKIDVYSADGTSNIWWSSGGPNNLSTVTIQMRGYSSAPSTTPAIACAAGTLLATLGPFNDKTAGINTATSSDTGTYRYVTACVFDTTLLSGNLYFSAVKIWMYQ